MRARVVPRTALFSPSLSEFSSPSVALGARRSMYIRKMGTSSVFHHVDDVSSPLPVPTVARGKWT
eukprot:8946179-Lingulodinium_polyedra.AAC.1